MVDTVFAMKDRTAEEVNRCRAWVKDNLPAGSRVYFMVRHVSDSGMSRRVSFFAAVGGSVVCLDYWFSRIIGKPLDGRKPGILYSGCGYSPGCEGIADVSMRIHGSADALISHSL